MKSGFVQGGAAVSLGAIAALALSGSAAAATIVSSTTSLVGQSVQLSMGAARQLVGTEAAVAILPSTSTSGGVGLIPLVVGLMATLVGFVLVRRSQTN